MKKYLIIYKPFLLFLSKFFLAYLVLTMVYQGYLNRFDATQVDTITKAVAEQAKQVLSLLNTDSAIVESKSEPFIKIFYHQQYVARVIEGCNAISVIILFIAFVIAFSGKLKPTVFFILGGSLFIYILNILRIAILSVLMYHFPDQEHLLHGVIFPLIIYGAVFILWVIWVNKFSKYASKDTK